ncbi:MAG: non-heme iron oxygenase ferredoxin subunit [Chloroflexi bacterium]|nr:non-heme iron oxygenase ferredoxin subunit [Chloroflexota bacterium]
MGFRAAEAAVAAADAAASGGGSGDDFEEVADSTVVPEGEVIGVDVAGQHVVVGRVDGQVYAIGGICTHQYAELEEGGLDGEIVMCPLHDSGFNIKTGAAVRLPASTPVPTYAVKEENGKIYVGRQPAAQS